MTPPPSPTKILIIEANRLCAREAQRAAQASAPNAEVVCVSSIADGHQILTDTVADLLVAGEGIQGDILDYLGMWLSIPKRAKRALVITSRRDERAIAAFNALPL